MRWRAGWPIAAAMLTSGLSAAAAAKPSERELLTRWAVARCLAHELPDEASRQDAARTAGGYLELGAAGPEAYERIEAFIIAATKRPMASVTGKSIDTMKCTDLVGDPSLGREIGRALKKGR